MGVEPTLLTVCYKGQPMVVGEGEVARLVVLWCAHNGHRLRHHELIGTVGVEIHTRQKCCLCWMRLVEKEEKISLKIRV